MPDVWDRERFCVNTDILDRACHKGPTRKDGIRIGFVQEQVLERPKKTDGLYLLSLTHSKQRSRALM